MRVVFVGLYTDPEHRAPDVLVDGGWRGFGRAAIAVAGAGHTRIRVSIVQAASRDAEREIAGVPCSFVRVRTPLGVGRVIDRVRALGPDLIHYQGFVRPFGLGRLLRAFPQTPVLVQDHGTKRAALGGWRRLLYRRSLTNVAAVAFTSRAQADAFVAAGILPRGIRAFEVIEISTRFAPGDQEAARRETGLAGDPCLLWAGQLDANKDPLRILDAVSRTARALPATRLYMCYRSAPLLEVVRARVDDDPSLAQRVVLVGHVPHAAMERYFQAADFLVQASHDEGSGGALIESLACGTTPIVTDIPSFRRITGNGVCGGLVPLTGGDFATTIATWAARDKAGLRRSARQHFERELSFEAMGRQLCQTYLALRQSSRP